MVILTKVVTKKMVRSVVVYVKNICITLIRLLVKINNQTKPLSIGILFQNKSVAQLLDVHDKCRFLIGNATLMTNCPNEDRQCLAAFSIT